MGFNINVIGVKNIENFDCSKFIERSWYNFTTSYDMYEDESVLIKAGEYFGLDLKELSIHIYSDSLYGEDYDYIKDCEISIEKILPILKQFKSNVIDEPNFLEKVNFTSKDNIGQKQFFLHYTSSSFFINDLTNLIQSIECCQKEGESHIYFMAG